MLIWVCEEAESVKTLSRLFGIAVADQWERNPTRTCSLVSLLFSKTEMNEWENVFFYVSV